MIDIQDLLREVSPDAPCGDDLEYDPDFGALERAAQGKPEQQFGSTIVPAEDPEWPEVQRLAIGLLGRTKDLRIAALLTRALVRTQGWSGVRDGLALIEGLLGRYWQELHPRLDPDEDMDPTLRINAIFSLSDPSTMLDALRNAPLVSSRALGIFSLRDLQIAANELPVPPESPIPDANLIEAAFQEVALEDLRATAEAIDQSLKLITAIDTLLMERLGATQAPDLGRLIELVRTARKAIGPPLVKRTGIPLESEDALGDQATAATQDFASAVSPGDLSAINNRDDVVRALDLLCDYYRRQEPSSPIPLLLQRAKRLVPKDFLEILEDLAPDGLPQAQRLRGSEPNQ
ncbi:type VI secretion protein [Thiocystis violacea]|nr:type VI secretion protein [Thiocystis violacea]